MPVAKKRAPVFESLAFRVEIARGRQPRQVAMGAVRRALPAGWTVRPLGPVPGSFEAVPRTRASAPRTPGRAWDLAYLMRDEPAVIYAEPLFTLDNAPQQRTAGRGVRSAGGEDDPHTAGKFEWPLMAMKVKAAWDRFTAHRPGHGVRIGHPDTGYTQHPEIVDSRLHPTLGYDFEDDDADPLDPLTGGILRSPGHGTATASVIFSATGAPVGIPATAFVSGTAPGATLVPIRTTKSVVLWSMSRLVKAIYHAVSQNCRVISMSLGGPVGGSALHDAVRYAESQGVIVLAAAGNQVRFVTYPAAFDEVIAVAASTIDDEEWSGSCRGDAVDVTAPGHSVYRARVQKKNHGPAYSVERSSGTSYAVAATAGVAALWLSYHGYATVAAKYGKDRMAAVFKQLLMKSARTPAGWDTHNFGAGIVQARRLLDEPLPDQAPARGLRGLRMRQSSQDDPLEQAIAMLAPATRSGATRALASLIGVPEDQLPEVMGNVGLELTFHIGTDEKLRQQLIAAAQAATGRGVRTARTPARRVALARGSQRLRSVLKG